MIDLSDSFVINGIRCYRSQRDDHRVHFLATEPRPQTDMRGAPTLLLLVTDDTAILQLGGLWAPTELELSRLRAGLVQRFPDIGPAMAIELAPAPMTMHGATVELVQDGVSRPIATSKTSGASPYSAIFRAILGPEDRSLLEAAVRGRRGVLHLRYDADLVAIVAATTSITGLAAPLVAAVETDPSLEATLLVIDDAITAGALTLETTSEPGASTALKMRSCHHARAAAAARLVDLARTGRRVHAAEPLEAAAVEREPANVSVSAVTDVASWFRSGQGDTHIRVAPTVSSSDDTTLTDTDAIDLRLDFDATDAPLAYIQIKSGDAEATLQASGAPVARLRPDPGGIELTTNYTDGSPPFSMTIEPDALPTAGLTPRHLGLARIVIDATPLRDAGARKARMRIRFHPADTRHADAEQTFYFRNDDWSAQWWLVTRDSDEDHDGTLECDGRVTADDGRNVRYPATTTEGTEIVLTPISM